MPLKISSGAPITFQEAPLPLFSVRSQQRGRWNNYNPNTLRPIQIPIQLPFASCLRSCSLPAVSLRPRERRERKMPNHTRSISVRNKATLSIFPRLNPGWFLGEERRKLRSCRRRAPALNLRPKKIAI